MQSGTPRLIDKNYNITYKTAFKAPARHKFEGNHKEPLGQCSSTRKYIYSK